MAYRPKTEIALELYDRACGNGIRFAYLTFDEWYGAKPAFLRELDARGQRYVAETHKRFVAWLAPPPRIPRRGRDRRTPRMPAGTPKPAFLEALVAHPVVRDQAWQCYRVKDGERGPMVWEVKQARIHPKDDQDLPGPALHLIVARNVLHPEEIKYFISNAPPETPVEELVLVAFARWRIERCFEDQKGELGLDHYEGRRYRGLKRHLILTAVSYLFLSRVRQELRGEKSRGDRLPGTHRHDRGGAQLVAIRPGVPAALRTGGGRNSIRTKAPSAGTQEPFQNDPTQVASPRHMPNRPAPLPMERDLAL
jgi:SRSO17 transposase